MQCVTGQGCWPLCQMVPFGLDPVGWNIVNRQRNTSFVLWPNLEHHTMDKGLYQLQDWPANPQAPGMGWNSHIWSIISRQTSSKWWFHFPWLPKTHFHRNFIFFPVPIIGIASDSNMCPLKTCTRKTIQGYLYHPWGAVAFTTPQKLKCHIRAHHPRIHLWSFKFKEGTSGKSLTPFHFLVFKYDVVLKTARVAIWVLSRIQEAFWPPYLWVVRHVEPDGIDTKHSRQWEAFHATYIVACQQVLSSTDNYGILFLRVPHKLPIALGAVIYLDTEK